MRGSSEVERLAHNQEDNGSIPFPASIFSFFFKCVIMNIKVFKLISGEDVLGEVVSESDMITIKNPVAISIVRASDGMPNVGFSPFPLHAEQKSGETIDIVHSNVVYSYVPAEDFIKNYDQIFGSGIILPPKQLITS